MMKNVLMVTLCWPPNNSAGVYRPLKFAKYLPKYGWGPTVVTAYPHGITKAQCCETERSGVHEVHRVSPRGDGDLARLLSALVWPFLRVLGMSRRHYEKGLVWRTRRLLRFPDPRTCFNRWIVPLTAKAVQLVRTRKYSAIYVTSPPQSMVIVARMVSALCHLPVVLDLRDPWTQNFVYAYTGFRDWLARKIEAASIRSAARVVVVTPEQAVDLGALYPFARRKIQCITNGFDPDDIPDLGSFERKDRFVVSLVGMSYEDPHPLFAAIRQNIKADPVFAKKFVFRWIGCNRREGLQVRDLQHSGNVELHPRLPHRKALEMAAQTHALWLEVPLTDRAKYVIRGKTFEYLALRKPLLGTAPAQSCTRKLLAPLCNCRFVASRDPKTIALLLVEAFRDWKRGTLVSQTDVEAVQQFRRDVLAGKLADLLDECSQR